MRHFATIALISGLTSCSEGVPSAPVTPASVIANINAWDGETVEVEGWLGRCEDLDCAIYSTLSDLLTPYSETKVGYEAWSNAQDRALSIGSTGTFDDAAEPLQFTYVRITARVNDECWPNRCLDRASDLEPISIEQLFPISEDE